VLFRLLAFVEHGARYTSTARTAPAGAAGIPLGAFGEAYSEQVNTARFDGAAHGALPAWRGQGADVPAGARAGSTALAAAARSVRGRTASATDDTGVGRGPTGVDGSSSAGGPAGDGGSGPPRTAPPGNAPPAVGQSPVGHRPRPPRGGPGSAARGATGGGPTPLARHIAPRADHPARRSVTGAAHPADPGFAAPTARTTPAVRRRSDDIDVKGRPR
jgi:hypothetical protein